MKRLIFLLITSICILNVQAQHLTFMGIELGNKVSKFHKELTNKGFMRAFSHNIGDVYKNGTFAGHQAEVLLYRQQPSKRIKSAAAKIVGDYELPEAFRILDELRNKIAEKYPAATMTDISEGSALPHLSFIIHNEFDERINLLIDGDNKVNVIYVGDLTKRDPNDDI